MHAIKKMKKSFEHWGEANVNVSRMKNMGKKQYLQKKNIFHVRQLYRSPYKMQLFAGNYSHDQRFEKSDWLCFCKEAREDESYESHPTSGQCKVYGDLCEKFSDLTDDESLVPFFIEVLARRDMLQKL